MWSCSSGASSCRPCSCSCVSCTPAAHLGRPLRQVAKLAGRNKRFAAIDRAISRNGLKFVTLLRLSPLLPLAVSNYLYGLTSVDLGSYVLGSWLGMLPGGMLALAVVLGFHFPAGLVERGSVARSLGMLQGGMRGWDWLCREIKLSAVFSGLLLHSRAGLELACAPVCVAQLFHQATDGPAACRMGTSGLN